MGEKKSKHAVVTGDVAGMLARFAELKRKARARTERCFSIIVIQEAGLDGFWIHRVLEAGGIESHVVDPASIATASLQICERIDAALKEATDDSVTSIHVDPENKAKRPGIVVI